MLITKIKNNLYLSILAFILFLIVLQNYTPGTFLTGWDNLHTEFNFPINIERAIFSVWQEYQGLGLLAGMAHASDLPRELFLWVVSVILPTSLIRYFYHFLMLSLGVFGMYFFVKKILFANLEESLQKKGAFLAALFYLLNLGTVQYFFTPFEPYSTFWGLFPWEIFALFSFLKNPSKKNLLFLFLVNLFAIPQAYVQTVFFVYILCVSLILAAFVFLKKSKAAILLSLKTFFIILAINSFWLLPNFYFFVKDVKVTQNSIHNRIDTQRFYEMNKKRGTILDFALLKEYGYDFLETDPNSQKNVYLLRTWRNHVSFWPITAIGYFSFLIILFGIFRKNKYRPFFLPIFLLCAFAFLSDTFIISNINDVLRSVPVLNQIFRNPFTKFIVPAIFTFSAFFTIGIMALMEKFSNLSFANMRNLFSHQFSVLGYQNPPDGGVNRLSVNQLLTNRKLITDIIFILISCALIIYGFPAFSGNLISKSVRVKIPNEYFNLFNFFSSQDQNARIMNLPQGSFWGWGNYQWGVTGSGFLWYGIKQPIMDRAFDVWSDKLEGYYWELSYALKKNDQNLLNQILEKYNISFILFDPKYTPSDSNGLKELYKQEDLLKNNPKIAFVKNFGPLRLYKTKLETKYKNNISFLNKLNLVNNPEPFSHKDEVFLNFGNYYSSSDPKRSRGRVEKLSSYENPEFVFPFGSLFSNRLQDENIFTIEEKQDYFLIKSKTSIPKGNYFLQYPKLSAFEDFIPVNIYAKKSFNELEIKLIIKTPIITIGNSKISNTETVKEVTLPLSFLDQDSSFIISVNNRDFFPVFPETEPKLVGSTYILNANEANTVRVYTQKDPQVENISIKNFSSANECEIKQGEKLINAKIETNLLTLKAKNTSVCISNTKALSIPSNSLVKVSFNYKSLTDEFPHYCFSDDGNCINFKPAYNIFRNFSNQKETYTDYFEVDEPKIPGLNFILEATELEDLNKIKQIEYQDVVVTSYKNIASTVVEIDKQTDQIQNEAQINVPKESFVEVEIPKAKNSYSLNEVLLRKMYKKGILINSELPEIGNGYFKEIGKNQLRIFGKNTYAQFLLRLNDLDSNLGYLLSVKSKNVKGFPFLINIFTPKNHTKYLYTFTSKNSNFVKDYFILPSIYEFDKGMNIIFMSASFNNNPSINDIDNISLYPLPYDFLTKIYFQQLSTLRHCEPEGRGNLIDKDCSPQDKEKNRVLVKKDALYKYEVSGNLNNDYLILSQSYHDGWKLYQVQSSKFKVQNWFNKTFPFIFGSELKEHVLVNNWANGWIINSSKFKVQSSKLIIIFWPQYLEYLGFLLLLGTVVYMVKLSK